MIFMDDNRSDREKQFALMTVDQIRKYSQQIADWVNRSDHVRDDALEHITFGRFKGQPPAGYLRLFRHVTHNVRQPSADLSKGRLYLCQVEGYFHLSLTHLKTNNNRILRDMVSKQLQESVKLSTGFYNAAGSRNSAWHATFSWVFVRENKFRSPVPNQIDRYRVCLLMLDLLAHMYFKVPADKFKSPEDL